MLEVDISPIVPLLSRSLVKQNLVQEDSTATENDSLLTEEMVLLEPKRYSQ